MDGDRIYLGRALSRDGGPLVTVDHKGDAVATWPWGHVPHAAVVGGTGGGKTTLLRVMATDLLRTPGDRGIALADGKGGNSFMAFAGLPGIIGPANGQTAVTEMVTATHAEMRARLAALDTARQRAAATRGRPDYIAPADLFLFLDEFMAWILEVPDTKGDGGRKHLHRLLVEMGLLGREVGVRLLLAMQRPDAKSVDVGLPGSLKAQLKCRIAATGVMGMDSLEARMTFDDDAYANRVPMRTGGGLVKVGRHEVAFVVPWMADPTDPGTGDDDRVAAWALLPPGGAR
jgi:DNA segregation ATPase FtsK/SpoIIIE-like protein